MLVLTRKKNETLHIGDEVSVTIIRVCGNKVRLGISAPDELRIHRTGSNATVAAVPEPVDVEVNKAA